MLWRSETIAAQENSDAQNGEIQFQPERDFLSRTVLS
jgi:hypothetical protein